MRLGVMSNERLNPWVNWSTLGPPLLHPLASNPGARLIAPPPIARQNLQAWGEVFRDMRSVDTLFWMQGSARPEFPVHLATALAGFSRRAAFVVDPWKPAINKIGWLALAQRLNPCFVPYREAYDDLRAAFPSGRFQWLPFAVDTNVFKSTGAKRDIFAFWMGRRYEPLHEALLRYCEDRGLAYEFRRPGVFLSTAELGEMAGRSQYFVVTPPDLDTAKRTGGYSPLVMRYMEGLAAGARLLGVLPRSGEYEALLPEAAILQVSPDGSDLDARLDDDRRDPSAAAAVLLGQDIVRAEHSWARRAEQIFTALGGPESLRDQTPAV